MLQSLGKVPEGSGAAEPRFRIFPVQRQGEVPEDSVANLEGSGAEGISIGAEGSGADIGVRFRKVPVQKVLAQKIAVNVKTKKNCQAVGHSA